MTPEEIRDERDRHIYPPNAPTQLDRIEALLRNVMDKLAHGDGFCGGHPYSHSFATSGGVCSTCGKPLRNYFTSGGSHHA